jgi:hypothetical protein
VEKKSVGLLGLETAVLECFLEKTPLSPLGVKAYPFGIFKFSFIFLSKWCISWNKSTIIKRCSQGRELARKVVFTESACFSFVYRNVKRRTFLQTCTQDGEVPRLPCYSQENHCSSTCTPNVDKPPLWRMQLKHGSLVYFIVVFNLYRNWAFSTSMFGTSIVAHHNSNKDCVVGHVCIEHAHVTLEHFYHFYQSNTSKLTTMVDPFNNHTSQPLHST